MGHSCLLGNIRIMAKPPTLDLLLRKELRVVESWRFAEKHYLGHVGALPELAARFDVARLISRYPVERANIAM